MRVIGILVLLGSIVGGSSIGTLANFIPVKSSFAKNAWRSGLLFMIFIMPSFVEYLKKRKTISYSKLISPK